VFLVKKKCVFRVGVATLQARIYKGPGGAPRNRTFSQDFTCQERDGLIPIACGCDVASEAGGTQCGNGERHGEENESYSSGDFL
jgi:hypothetical protein